MATIKISIVIPFFNRINLLLETVDSVRLQSFPNFELLLIDDGTQEIERKLLEDYLANVNDKRITLVDRPHYMPKGANSCRHFGYLNASGTYIKWFDSDDLMMPDLLERQLAAIEKGYDGVFCNCEVWNEDFTVLLRTGWRKKNFSEAPLHDYLRTQMAWQTGCGLWQKDKLTDLKPFTENIGNAQEWIFHLKALCSGLNIAVSREILVKIRRHEASISGKRSNHYFINRFRARCLVLLFLFEAKAKGKRYLLKSLTYMFFNDRIYLQAEIYVIIFSTIIQIPGKLLNAKPQQISLILLS
jgi:glycosyltransferase involved in cell wall biosynthesis